MEIKLYEKGKTKPNEFKIVGKLIENTETKNTYTFKYDFSKMIAYKTKYNCIISINNYSYFTNLNFFQKLKLKYIFKETSVQKHTWKYIGLTPIIYLILSKRDTIIFWLKKILNNIQLEM